MSVINDYPNFAEIETANRYILCKWQRFLRSPKTEAEVDKGNLIFKRWKEAGGFTPAISKALGW